MVADFESGFFVREEAWHGLGNVLEHSPDTLEGLKQSGLDWRVTLEPVKAHLEDPMGTIELELPDNFAVVRERNGGDPEALAVVGSKYTPLQNREAFQWFDPILHEGNAKLEAAGSLKGGRVVWVLARIGDDGEVSGGDPVSPYLLLSNSHDGSRAVGVQFTPIRVVCWNTLSYAHSLSKGKDIQVRHTANVKKTLDAVRDLLDLSNRTFSVSLEQYRAMQAKGLNAQGLDRYIREVFATDAVIQAALDAQLEVKEAREGKGLLGMPPLELPAPRALKKCVQLFESGPGAKMAGPTVFGAYQAVTHYIDHVRGRNPDNSLHGTWFGSGQETRNRAHEKALELV
jgi:phage/plasmid-like protein (TIGR03299 family)